MDSANSYGRKPTEPAELRCFGHPYRKTAVACLELALQLQQRFSDGTCIKGSNEQQGVVSGCPTRVQKSEASPSRRISASLFERPNSRDAPRVKALVNTRHP